MVQNIFIAQAEEILKFKWIESQKAGHDVGEMWAAQTWIKRYAKAFRKYWRKVNNKY